MARVIDVVLSLRDEATKKLENAQKAMYGYTSSMMSTGRQLKRTGGSMESLGKSTLAMTAPLLAVGGMAIKTGMEFDKSMSQVKAVSNATTSDFARLRKEALRVGETTAKSASDAANGMVFLSQAGYKVNDVLRLSKPLVDLAVAGNIEMAQASSLMADSMNAANIPVQDAVKYLNQVAQASNVSNTDIPQLMEAWIGVGGSMRTANISMAQSNAMLSILANAGIKGAEAGTSLSRIFMNLNATTGEASKAMKSLGISVADSSGKMRSKADVLKELKAKTDKLTEAERNNYIQMIGGKQYANDLKILLDGMGGTFDSLTTQIEGSNGALGRMAKTMGDNLQGDITTFRSALEGGLISISNALTPFARNVIQIATKLVSQIKNVDPAIIQIIAAITLGVAAFGSANLVIGMFIKTLGSMMTSAGSVIRIFSRMSLGSIGMIAGILAVIAVIYLLVKNFDKIKEVVSNVVDAIVGFIDSTIGIDNIKNDIGALKSAFQDLLKQASPILKFIGGLFMELFGVVKSIVIPLAQILGTVLVAGFKMMLKTAYEIVSGVIQTFTGIATFFSGLAQVISAIFSGDWKKAGEGLKKMFNGLVMAVMGIWRSLTAFLRVPAKAVVTLISSSFNSAVNKAKSLWNGLKSALSKIARGTISATASKFNSVINGVKRAWNNLKAFLKNPIRGTINLIKNGSVDGSHKTGLGRVPFDGYRAELHKDEMVLTKSEADSYRSGPVASEKSVVVNFAKIADVLQIREEADAEKIARAIAKQIRYSV